MEAECSICEKRFSNSFAVKRHRTKIHNISDEKKPLLLEFQSKDDFLRWKSKIEEETSSSYISRTKVNREKEVYRYYECCRSGKYVPKGKGQRCLKSQKSAKIGQKCPSRIKLKISESTYFVQYFKDHAGHGTDLEHLRLPTSFRAAVAGHAVSIPSSESCSKKEEEVFAAIQCLQTTEPCQRKTPSVNIINKAHGFIEAYNKSSLTEEDEEKLNKYLDKMLTICANSQSSGDPKRKEEKSLKRKIEAQLPLFSTKKRNKYKKPPIKNPTYNEAKVIKESLLTDSQPVNVHTEFDHTY